MNAYLQLWRCSTIGKNGSSEVWRVCFHAGEPNVKNGCGGLRDYQNMQWICYFRDGGDEYGKAGGAECTSLRAFIGERSIGEVRMISNWVAGSELSSALHKQTMPVDVLTLFLQGQVANHFNYPAEDSGPPQ